MSGQGRCTTHYTLRPETTKLRGRDAVRKTREDLLGRHKGPRKNPLALGTRLKTQQPEFPEEAKAVHKTMARPRCRKTFCPKAAQEADGKPATPERRSCIEVKCQAETETKVDNSSDSSFTAVDNVNELAMEQALEAGSKAGSKANSEERRGRAPTVRSERGDAPNTKVYKGSPGRPAPNVDMLQRVHFDAEMYSHGLLEKIEHIQQLNSYFELELGSSRKLNDSVRNAGDGSSGGTSFDKVSKATEIEANTNSNTNANMSTNGGTFAFPFQKRARSYSPPRNGPLFDPNQSKLDASNRKMPILATANFVVNPHTRQTHLARCAEQLHQVLTSEDCGEAVALSTGPTKEEPQDTQRSRVRITSLKDQNDWMYQRLDSHLHPEAIDSEAATDPNYQGMLDLLAELKI